jgi:hypothetical protein
LKFRIPSNTFKKGCIDGDAAAHTSPRVSSGTRRGAGKWYTQCPSRRNGGARGRRRVGAGLPTRISPDPQKNHDPNAPSRSTKLVAHQLAPPRSCNHLRHLTVTKVAKSTGMKRGNRE